ncbi:MltA domain-containing protein [Neisseriaceae bacterium JH1-16]|nr:MltA domain-containing protein [Neisseriaceae bacterium JH1-16]
MFKRFLLLLPLIWLAACSTAPRAPISSGGTAGGGNARYASVGFGQLPDWNAQQSGATLLALQQSCKTLQKRAGWASVCSEASRVSPDDAAAVRQFFETRFVPWQMRDGANSTGLITGYYEPLLSGSRSKSARTPYPVYGAPADLLSLDVSAADRGRSVLVARRAGAKRLAVVPGKASAGVGEFELHPADFSNDGRSKTMKGRIDGNRFVPYYTRAQIAQGMGVNSAQVLAWVENPVELFFLQVQGSGRIQLDDGSFLRVGFADMNGYPYQSIGKWLVSQGQMTLGDASMQGIQDWIARNPSRQDELFNVNPSYIFFRTLGHPEGGPLGAMGVPLTDGYSIAVDPHYIPLGSPVYLSTTYPLSTQPLNRLVHAQDTGTAIRGALRADFFWGFGTEAGMYAGRMKQQGSLWLLLPKGMNPPA